MKKIFLWAVLALFVWEFAVSAQGRAPRPSDFWASQFASGVVGEIAGGVLGLGVLGAACAQIESFCAFLHPSYLPLHLPAEGWTREPAFLMINLGRAAGALAGVAIFGAIHEIQGNILVAYIASGAWFITATAFPIVALPTVPALVATAGFQWGAKMKPQKKASSWYMPLISLAF